MAIFGKVNDVKKQITNKYFQIAFNYLENNSNDFTNIKENECVKKELSDDMFILKQIYKTKNRSDCFFESHKKYIDIQFMSKGEEYMDVTDISSLKQLNEYDEKTDFIKYEGKEENISKLLIRQNELAIFYPSDAHQPCIKTEKEEIIYKVVIKIPVELV